MVLAHSDEELNATVKTNLANFCLLCEKEMAMLSDCLSTKCKHIFHKECITKWMRDSHDCPKCKALCHERDLVVPRQAPPAKSLAPGEELNSSVSKTNTIHNGGRGRGSAIKRYQTRSTSRQEESKSSQVTPAEAGGNNVSKVPIMDLNIVMSPNPNVSQLSINQSNGSHHYNRNRRTQVDYDQITQMIESSVQRLLSDLNINSPLPQQTSPLSANPQTNLSTNRNPNSQSYSFFFNTNSAKVTAIIQNWNVKFDGSSNGLRCEEFLYRIRCLTNENFNGNFECICANLHILLTGKAKDWYWKYHKSVDRIHWEFFCSELKKQYKDYRTTYDIREELHSRKQKPSESFETFFDAITNISDRLEVPLEDEDLIEIVTRNLRPEIRHELLYVQIRSISHLKKLCLMREKLLNEKYFKKTSFNRVPNNINSNRKIATIESGENKFVESADTHAPNDDNTEYKVNALSSIQNPVKCWNCDDEGHYWDMCLRERKIFCYGCGLKNVYKPQCINCAKNPKNSKNFVSNHRQK